MTVAEVQYTFCSFYSDMHSSELDLMHIHCAANTISIIVGRCEYGIALWVHMLKMLLFAQSKVDRRIKSMCRVAA